MPKMRNGSQIPVYSKSNAVSDDDLVQLKLSIICPVLYGSHTESSDRKYLLEESKKEYKIPGCDETYKFSLKTFERWCREIRAQQAELEKSGTHSVYEAAYMVLARRERSDKGDSRKISASIGLAIAHYLNECPTANAVAIQKRLLKDNVIHSLTDVSTDTIRRYIDNNQLRTLTVIDEDRLRNSFFMREFGQLWEADTCYYTKVWDPEHREEIWCYVQGILDDHSRKVVALKAYTHDTSLNFQITLRDAIRRYGIPEALFVDLGSPYNSKSLKRICNRLGIALRHTRPRDGAGKGAIERRWMVLQEDTKLDIVLDHIDSMEKVQTLLDDWTDKHNSTKCSSTNGIPNEMHTASTKRHHIRLVPNESYLSRMFEWEESRSMSKVGTVQVNNISFKVPDELRNDKKFPRKKISIHYDPMDVKGTIYILYNDKHYRIEPDDPYATGDEYRARAETRDKAREQKGMSTNEARAEARFERRMAGANLPTRTQNKPEILPLYTE